MTARSGRELVWAVQVNDVHFADLLDLIGVGADIGHHGRGDLRGELTSRAWH
jgi:hypothetical protein